MSLVNPKNWQLLPEAQLEQLNGKSILMTGATGLIGLNLLGFLAQHVATGRLDLDIFGVSRSGILPSQFSHREHVQMFSVDLSLEMNLGASLPPADFVVHGATYGQPAKFMDRPIETILLNTSVTAALAELSKEQFLFLSSSEVYSGLVGSPHKETEIGTSNTDHPRACYIEGKRAGEAVTLAIGKMNKGAKVARLSLVYGPGARWDDQRVMYELIKRALTSGYVSLRGSGSSKRSYLYVNDAIQLLVTIMLNGENGVYNLGGLETISLEGLAKKIAAAAEVEYRRPEPHTEPQSVGAPDNVKLDMSKTLALSSFSNPTTLEKGLPETITWMRSQADEEGL